MILCNFRSLFYFTYISVNSWYLNKPDEDWYCPVEMSQLKSISRCLISPCKSLLDCNVFNLIYFDWLRSFWIWRWASLIVHGFCIVVVVVVVVFFFFCTLIQHCLTVSITSPRHSISFVLKKGPATPPTHHTLFLDQTESFWNRTPLPLGLDDRTLPLYEGLDPSLLTSYQWMLWETTMTRSWQFERRGFDLEPVKLKYAFILNLTPAIFTHKLI